MRSFGVLTGMILGTGCAVGIDDKSVGGNSVPGSSDSLEAQNGIAKAGSTPPRGPAAEGGSSGGTTTDSTTGSSASGSATVSSSSADSDSATSKVGASDGDLSGTTGGGDASEAESAESPSVSETTATASSSDTTTTADPEPSCPGGNPNSIVKIYGSVGVNADSKVSYLNLGYSTCADPGAVTWAVRSGPEVNAVSVDALSGILTLTENRVVGTKSSSIYQLVKILGDGSTPAVSLPTIDPAPAELISGNHVCPTPATSIVVVQKNSDSSIKQFCLMTGDKLCTCPAVIEPTPTPSASVSPLPGPTAVAAPKAPTVKLK